MTSKQDRKIKKKGSIIAKKVELYWKRLGPRGREKEIKEFKEFLENFHLSEED